MEHSKPAVVEADQEVRHVQSIHGPLAWNGKDVRLSDNTVTLQPDEVDEVEGALKAFKGEFSSGPSLLSPMPLLTSGRILRPRA